MSNEEVFLHARFGRAEPSGKSSLLYDLCKLNEIHVLKMTSYDERMENHENHVLHATHQIAESWIHASRKRLKNQLSVKSSKMISFCFRSKKLVELMKMCRDLRHKVPEILEVEVDPKGAPRIQEAIMKLYVSKSAFEKIHLLQAMHLRISSL
ncbi:Nematode resistance protein-like HSPRO2 [Glycine max]|nr:Nematode resistance protein-like HSPRO2 [Glycine max]